MFKIAHYMVIMYYYYLFIITRNIFIPPLNDYIFTLLAVWTKVQ